MCVCIFIIYVIPTLTAPLWRYCYLLIIWQMFIIRWQMFISIDDRCLTLDNICCWPSPGGVDKRRERERVWMYMEKKDGCRQLTVSEDADDDDDDDKIDSLLSVCIINLLQYWDNSFIRYSLYTNVQRWRVCNNGNELQTPGPYPRGRI